MAKRGGKSIVEIAKDKGLTPKQIGAKGGAATKGKTKFKVNPNRRCIASACPIYPCWAAPSSNQFKGKCALAQIGESTQNFTVDILENGQNGFDNQMMQILSKVAFLANKPESANSFGVQSKLLKEIRDTKIAIYGQKVADDPTQIEELKQTNQLIAKIVNQGADKAEQDLISKYSVNNGGKD